METEVIKPRLVNAKKMSIQYPEQFSFQEEEINNIKVGDIVKVSNKQERLWVVIENIKGDEIIGRVDSGLIVTSGYNYGDLISFKRENIYQVWDDEM